MALFAENCIALLNRAFISDALTDNDVVWPLFLCPANHYAIIIEVVAHSNTATLAGMTDIDFGTGASLDWVAAHDLEDMTVANDFKVIRADDAEYAMIDGDDATVADRTFNLNIDEGSTGAAAVTFDVFGYLIKKS